MRFFLGFISLLLLISCDKKSKVEKAVEEIPIEVKVVRFEKDFFEYLFQERIFLYFLNYKKYKQALITVSRLKFKHKTKLLSTIIFGKKD